MKEGQVIIIKKKRGHGHGHHGGAWKVAYADFVTAMMAFFLVMWIVGQSEQVKAAIAGYFKDPGIFDRESSDGAIEGGAVQIDPEALPEPLAQQQVLADDREELEQTASRIRDLLQQAPDVQGLEDQVEITLTKDGLRIELLESNDGTFFDSGSAHPKPFTERALAIVAGELGKLRNSVIVEGHTDSEAFGSDRYTNWELSTDRANSARRVMETSGLYENQVQGIRGFADTHLRTPEDPYDSSNRRVSIIVQNVYRPELLPERLRGGGGVEPESTRTDDVERSADDPSTSDEAVPADEDETVELSLAERRRRRRR